MYVHHETGERIVECPDPAAGLYVMDRRRRSRASNDNTDDNTNNDYTKEVYSKAVRVVIPPDCVAVQVGECTQIVTGGAVQATPHCVRGCRPQYGGSTVARISLPCFVDTAPSFALCLPPGSTRDDVWKADCSNNQVPPLEARWHSDGMAFGDFLHTTFEMYYNWKAD